MVGILKKWALALLGDYAIYFIYRREADAASASPQARHGPFDLRRLDEDAARASTEPLILAQLEYLGTGAHAFACMDGARIVGLCVYWHGDRYRRRNFWPLAGGEAKLVQIVTLPDMQGRGIAGSLIGWSAQAMFDAGFSRLYARIWHSNKASWRAFARAGWKRIALVIEVEPLRRIGPLWICLGRRPRARRD